MPKLMSNDAIAQYRDDGYYFPIKILDDEQVATSRAQLEKFESDQGQPISGAQRNKSHLLFKWVDDLMRDSKILDAVEDLRVTHQIVYPLEEQVRFVALRSRNGLTI